MRRRELLLTAPALLSVPALGAAPGGKARFRSAICAYSFRKELESKAMKYDDLVHRCVDRGIDGLDLTVYWFPNTSDEFLLPLKNLAFRNGVEIYSISVRSEMTQPTAAGRAKEVDGVKKWVDVAAKLGAGHIRVFGGKVPEGTSESQAAGWVAEVLKPAAEYAGTKGVILGLENHGGITLRAERIIEIVKKVDSPWVGINLDTGNFREEPYEQIEMCLPHAVNAQFKTEMHYADGRREPSDWERIVKLFAKYGYKGYLALEYEGKAPASEAFDGYMGKLQALVRKYTA
jgi:sugar phosphate isomerase/epimerase